MAPGLLWITISQAIMFSNALDHFMFCFNILSQQKQTADKYIVELKQKYKVV